MSDFYDIHAETLSARYEGVAAEAVHGAWLHLLPSTKGLILDVGAGSGRDAAWLAERGHEVVAVEPAAAMRRGAQARHPHANIQWLDDRLPALERVHQLDYQFDAVVLSAVWMHVPPASRERAFRKLAHLLRPGGILVITLRDGPSGDAREMHPVSAEEVRELGRRFALEVVLDGGDGEDRLGREAVRWRTVVLRLPDDGTGALPLLRHVVVNDDVSSTYKLALLRALLRIADGARGVVLRKDEDEVVVPFGLVALFWVRQYRQLVLGRGYLQRPGENKLRFAKASFRALADVSPHDLRVGMRFTGERARQVVGALRDARNTIRHMPARYITFPGTDEAIFRCDTRSTRLPDDVTVDLDFLAGMGTFTIPRAVWEAMSRYACWIEPAIVDRWCALMGGYDERAGREVPLGDYRRSLTWLDAERSTAEVRAIAERVRARGRTLYCTWTGRRLHRSYDIDHCFPFAHWPNNDLWNLLPAHPSVNNRKRDRLPSAEALDRARERVLTWWHEAYLAGTHRERFVNEASISLPGVRHLEPQRAPHERILAGMQNQRIRLKTDQQIAEWGV